jgi:hypothetical protein
MNNTSSTSDLFFEDLARIFEFRVAAVTDALTNAVVGGGMKFKLTKYAKLREAARVHNLSADDVRPAVQDIVEGVLHSVLSIFDGSTALWEKTTIDLRDAEGNALGGSLATSFVAYLERTGRIKPQTSDLRTRH